MPTYEYRCGKCGYEFELFQRMNDPAIRDCPECKTKNSVVKMIGGGAGIIFKGSGFYETDYKKSKRNNDNANCKSCPAKDNACPKNNK
ncbi:MAG: zinc ribbon domain-containing protein [bacterium]|nr:zinc ribbon domain-containing protein [bacterium]